MDSDSCVQGVQQTERWVGAYILHIRSRRSAQIQVGRYNGGRPVNFAEGHYLYVGSAMGAGDGLYLPRRLVRHATRSAGLPPHACRDCLLAHFAKAGLSADRLTPSSSKRLFWNIDYLLNHAEAELQDILYFRSENRLEFAIAQRLESRGNTHAPAPGLGAHDHRGHTHFLAISGGSRAWTDCSQDLVAFIAAM